jgi:hypothetical protein
MDNYSPLETITLTEGCRFVSPASFSRLNTDETKSSREKESARGPLPSLARIEMIPGNRRRARQRAKEVCLTGQGHVPAGAMGEGVCPGHPLLSFAKGRVLQGGPGVMCSG